MKNIIDKLVIKSWGLANGESLDCFFENTSIRIKGVNSTDGLRFFLLFKTGRDFAKVFLELKVGKVSHKMCYPGTEEFFEILVILKKEELELIESLLVEERNDSTPFLAEAFASRYND